MNNTQVVEGQIKLQKAIVEHAQKQLDEAKGRLFALEDRYAELTKANDFRIFQMSSNTNSFGLYQLVLINRLGDVYITHASHYNVNLGGIYKLENGTFRGCEMTSKSEVKALEVHIEKVWSEKH